MCDYQIPGLYGATLRSTPAFFLTDDHDMFENDEFDDTVATMPPDRYGTLAAEQTQRLYYPEFLPDRNCPAWLPGADDLAGAPADVTPDKLTFTQFMWRPPQPVAEIDTMKPALVYEAPRKS